MVWRGKRRVWRHRATEPQAPVPAARIGGTAAQARREPTPARMHTRLVCRLRRSMRRPVSGRSRFTTIDAGRADQGQPRGGERRATHAPRAQAQNLSRAAQKDAAIARVSRPKLEALGAIRTAGGGRRYSSLARQKGVRRHRGNRAAGASGGGPDQRHRDAGTARAAPRLLEVALGSGAGGRGPPWQVLASGRRWGVRPGTASALHPRKRNHAGTSAPRCLGVVGIW
jgi:hypothetical protein